MKMTPREAIAFGMKWVADNPDAWAYLKGAIRRDYAAGIRYFRLTPYVEELRRNGLRFRNSAAPYVTRRLERETGVKFVTNRSKIDLLMSEDAE